MMLHSNTDASSFRLQPAPRPKSKKRPQNPPALHLAPLAKASSSSIDQPASKTSAERSSSDSGSLRSSFKDDEEALTSKASLFHVPLLGKERVANIDNASFSPPRRSRASTTSLASVASTASSSSVTRLLAAMSLSTSPRHSTTAVQSESPSATFTVMLTNKAPTPSSPLFPRRTLMRSLSSTCLNNNTTSTKSPTSPVNRSNEAALRKRMGWRGVLSARMQEETAIIMSPGSPLTPRRASALHTPTQASITSVLDPSTHLPPYDNEEQMEPLSATLKALGAKRRTERFASTCVPVQSPTAQSPDVIDTLRNIKSPYSEAEFTGNQEKFQVMTATRKIFHLPTWVRFEANHHSRTRVADENRKAAAEFSKLQIASKTSHSDQKQVVMRGEALPKTSHLGDVAPDSPNGELFAGFEIDSPPHPAKTSDESEYVVSVVHRPTMAALREAESAKNAGGKMFASIRSALPPFRPQGRIKGLHPQSKPNQQQQLLSLSGAAAGFDKDRRDGWGGVLTRSSWFPNHSKGPLVSPSSLASKGEKGKGLKKMLLQPSPSKARSKGEDEWEDIEEPPTFVPEVAERSFLELEDALRFFNRPPPKTSGGWFPFLSRPRTQQQKVELIEQEHELGVWKTRPLKPSPADNEVISSELIAKGESSIENRPTTTRKQKNLSLRMRIAVIAVTAIIVAAIVANIVVLTHTAQPTQERKSVGVPTVGNLPLGIHSKPSGTSVAGSENSSVAKAAQLSQPLM